jgi:hypothetical protein
MDMKLDMTKLDPEVRRRVERALHPRDTLFSRKFAAADVRKWRKAAKLSRMTIQLWMEIHLRQAHTIGLRLDKPRSNPPLRNKVLSARFTAEDVEAWARLATLTISTRDWVEHVLNIASSWVS